MARGAEHHPLGGIGEVRLPVAVGGQQGVDVDEVLRQCRLASAGMSHPPIIALPPLPQKVQRGGPRIQQSGRQMYPCPRRIRPKELSASLVISVVR
jgi:hypothetical protein